MNPQLSAQPSYRQISLELSEKELRRCASDIGPSTLAIAEHRAIPDGPLRTMQNQLTAAFPGSTGLLIPFSLLRALSASTATEGGFLVGTQVFDNVSPTPRNRAVALVSGATIHEGLTENLSLPRGTAAGNLEWLPENDQCGEVELTVGVLNLTPRRQAGCFTVSDQLLRQSGAIASRWLSAEIRNAVAEGLEAAIFSGDGVFGEPLGLLGTTGTQSITFGAEATYAKAAEFEKLIADANADDTAAVWVTTPATRFKWRQISRSPYDGLALWKELDQVLGHRAFATKNVSGDKVVFGPMADVQVGIWGPGVEILVDKFTEARGAKIKYVVNFHGDCGPLHPQWWAISSDSGAQ